MQTPLNPDPRVVENYTTRRKLQVELAKTNPRYGKCGHKLAADNPGPLCGPCRRAHMLSNDEIDPRECYSRRRNGIPFVKVSNARALMKDRGMTTTELAVVCHIDKRTIQDWLLKNEAPLDGAEVLAQVLGTSVAQLGA